MHWETEQHIAAPAEIVWAVLTELDDAPSFMTTMVAVERIEGPAYDVGTRWRETRKHGRSTITQELTATVAEPPHRTVVASEAYGLRHEATMRVMPTPTGSTLSFTFDVSPLPETGRLKALVYGTASRLGAGVARETMTQDLADLADIAAEAERRAHAQS